MITFKRGDVVLIEFIFSDKTEKKQRPALIISKNDYNKKRQEMIILAITSNISRKLPGDTLLRNWKDSGLLKPSLVTGIFQTVKQSLIIRRLGCVTEEDLQSVELNIAKIV